MFVLKRQPFNTISLVATSLAVLVGCAGCPTAASRRTVRLIDGKPQPGRYVSPGAYEHYLRSQIALHHGEIQPAAMEVRAALAMDPRSPFLHHHLARILVRDNKLEAAQQALQEALEIQPGFPDALVLLGRLEWQQGRHERAEAHFRLCIRVNPTYPPAYLFLAELLEERDRPGAASAVLKQLLAGADDATEGHRRLAVLCLRQMDYTCAARHFALALRTRTDLQILLQLAHVYRSTGKLEIAVRLLREAFDRSGGNHQVASVLLELLRQTKQRQAVDDLLGILEQSADGDEEQAPQVALLALAAERPARALAYIEAQPQALRAKDAAQLVLGEALFEAGRAKEAEATLRQLLTGSKGVSATLRLARIIGRQRRHHEAVVVLREGLTRHGHHDELVLALSSALSSAGQTERSIQVVRDALKGRPDNRRLRFGLAAALEREGRWRQAIAQMRRLLKRHPKHAPAHNFIGYTQVEHKVDLAAAERSIRRALFLQPGEGYIIDSLGWLYFRRGDLARAHRLLLMASRLAPGEAEILAHVAEVNVSLKRLGKAVQLLRRAVKLSLDERLTSRLEQRIHELERRRVGTRAPE